MTQDALGERAKLKQGAISAFENGEQSPYLVQAVALAQALGVSLDELADVSSSDGAGAPTVELNHDQRTLLDLARRFGEGELLAFVEVKIGEVLREKGQKTGFLRPGLLVPPSGDSANRKLAGDQ